MGYENILFDLDGTLTDPYTGIINGVKYALNKFGIIEDDDDKLKLFIGPPLIWSFKEYYNFDSDKAKDAVNYYREYYSQKGIFENILYENIDILLKTLMQNMKKCMVATSKPTDFAERILKYFNIDNYFCYVLGSNLNGTFSDKDEIINKVIIDNNLDKSKTIMIGDRKHDIIGAKKNNIDSIAVLYGYGNREELEAVEPVFICNNVLDILDIIK